MAERSVTRALHDLGGAAERRKGFRSDHGNPILDVHGLKIEDPVTLELEIDGVALGRDLDDAWEVLAEPVQTVMRRHGIVDSYEQLKALTRGRAIDRAGLHAFIDGLDIPDASRQALKALTPASYVGLAAELARRV